MALINLINKRIWIPKTENTFLVQACDRTGWKYNEHNIGFKYTGFLNDCLTENNGDTNDASEYGYERMIPNPIVTEDGNELTVAGIFKLCVTKESHIPMTYHSVILIDNYTTKQRGFKPLIDPSNLASFAPNYNIRLQLQYKSKVNGSTYSLDVDTAAYDDTSDADNRLYEYDYANYEWLYAKQTYWNKTHPNDQITNLVWTANYYTALRPALSPSASTSDAFIDNLIDSVVNEVDEGDAEIGSTEITIKTAIMTPRTT